nr:hypothetical protein [Massilia sp. CCM 8734]
MNELIARLRLANEQTADAAAPEANRGRADVHALADVLNALSLLFDHSYHFQLQTGVEGLPFLAVMHYSSSGVFSTY